MVRVVVLMFLLLCGCTTSSTDIPKMGKEAEAPYGWQYTYCPSHPDEVGCKQFNR